MRTSDQIGKAWTEYGEFTAAASENARKLAFVGFALVLLLGGAAKSDFEGGEVVDLSGGLIVAGSCLVGALFLDILQYIYGALAHRTWAILEENRLNREGNASVAPKEGFPKAVGTPTDVLWLLKILAVAVGYGILLWHMAFKIG